MDGDGEPSEFERRVPAPQHPRERVLAGLAEVVREVHALRRDLAAQGGPEPGPEPQTDAGDRPGTPAGGGPLPARPPPVRRRRPVDFTQLGGALKNEVARS